MRFTRRDGEMVDLAQLDPRGSRIRSIRGNEIAMIFQEPMTSLSPVHTVGSEIAEAVELHQNVRKKQAMEFAEHMLGQVGIGNPKQRAQEYPHQFSGGMRQRAMIAMALSCNEPADRRRADYRARRDDSGADPGADEGAQAGSHGNFDDHPQPGRDRRIADRVAMMYTGKVVELADVKTSSESLHPYGRADALDSARRGQGERGWRRFGRRARSVRVAEGVFDALPGAEARAMLRPDDVPDRSEAGPLGAMRVSMNGGEPPAPTARRDWS
jgi:ABC-type glutathione transport system ATPase component